MGEVTTGIYSETTSGSGDVEDDDCCAAGFTGLALLGKDSRYTGMGPEFNTL